ncbi:phosphoglycerate dehydrogenase-like enzyme [Actinocorallia herbida]|uniref:Phosphoglycerate dehydrogenase-like enzyme n=1 Tax=Actinocorallia herbida TaxID=58109 RepID=A0A3N1CWJ8_9ACTN|nr:hydroxyacid dehydrogenase [Actinocorallia herbida]ROO85088.1 phosphoglycerate dehydrogenase-like enzyme [Actinocorallia herbida]
MATTTGRRLRAKLAMSRAVKESLFRPAAAHRLTQLADIDPDEVIEDFADARDLDSVDVLITGWGCPPLEHDVLERAPRLRAVIHTAGSVKHHITDACWERGIAVSSAAAANAVPVAEFTLAAILFAHKRVWQTSALYRRHRAFLPWTDHFPGVGNYRRTVGIVGASRIGRRVLDLLRPFDFEVLVADPYLDEAEAKSLGATLADLDTLIAASDTVSLHAPDLPETHQMIDRRRLGLLRDGATLINTARGALVDTEALTGELASGRIYAVLDVSCPEPLPPESDLYELPGVLLTPHIAGSLGNELERLAEHSLDELARLASGAPFAHAVQPGQLTRSA